VIKIPASKLINIERDKENLRKRREEAKKLYEEGKTLIEVAKILNIGSEAMKGNAQVKEADLHLSSAPINYIGYVEGDDIYMGDVDVVVCDGFIGNISLKTSEGVARMISCFMKEEFKKGLYNKLAALVALPVLRAFRKRIDPRAYNGASMLGLNGIVIKSHGGADAFAFEHAILEAVTEASHQVPQRIGRGLEAMLVTGQQA